ncbi:MAG: ATP-binding cassette domain-containing protein [Chloroflexi bacterium]|jgi:ABC-2 type transport system ATP-binding protein|nr:ATP-binding cassette domain-containing protein [Chloroflexota bacterium]
MDTIVVEHIAKSFGETQAVKDVSFSVRPGEIFGLLGPNGSGKTTSIRVILDIYQPEKGTVEILGGPMNEEKLNQIGYLPEERGLYQDVELSRNLTYLATLKNMTREEIDQKLPVWLERFDLSDHQKKKTKELSKGMQQKAQLIAALIHDPEIIIIDEPFTALDPVNTQLVKDLLIDLRDEGRTIMMSTHQMNQVEQLCDRLVLIDHGTVLLEGDLKEIQTQFATNQVLIQTDSELPENIKGVQSIQEEGLYYRLTPADGLSPRVVLQELIDQRISLSSFEIATPTLDEIFIKVVSEGRNGNEEDN